MTETDIAVVPKTNGSALPEHRQKQVEAGLAAYQRAAAERDELEKKLHDANVEISLLRIQLGALNGVVEMMQKSFESTESKVHEYQLQRDDAVAHAATVEATVANIRTIVNAMVNSDEEN